MARYIQSNFDKAFIKVVESLHSTRHDHGKFRSRKELLRKFGIIDNNYSAIKKGERGVPLEKYDTIKKIFKEEFDINPSFLNENIGDMSLTAQSRIVIDKDSLINNLQSRINNLRAELKTKEKIIALQEELIKSQKRALESINSEKIVKDVERMQADLERLQTQSKDISEGIQEIRLILPTTKDGMRSESKKEHPFNESLEKSNQ